VIRYAALALLLALGASPAHALDYGRNPAPTFELGSLGAGESPAHTLGFSIFRGELETYLVRFRYPDGFRFDGFTELGPSHTPVGSLELDLNADGAADTTVTLRSLGRYSAYADVFSDGRLSPGREPMLRYAGGGTFVLHLPLGGDGNPGTVTVPHDARVRLVLLPGVLTSPARAGTYVLTAVLVSVDPDTDGPDDGAGMAPVALAFEVSVRIQAPASVPFAALCVDKADLGHHRISIHGRYVLGAGTDGASFPEDTVTVTIGEFEQAVPGSAFKALGQGVQFVGRASGVKRLHIGSDGRFQLDVRDVDLGLNDRAEVPFSLQIGDDRGAADLSFDRHGHMRRHGTPRCGP
jgi:hypothetical protein